MICGKGKRAAGEELGQLVTHVQKNKGGLHLTLYEKLTQSESKAKM